MMRSSASKAATVLLLIGVGLLAPARPSAAGPAEPAAGRDQIVIGISQEPDTLNPLFAETSASLAVIATIFTVDVQRDEQGQAFAQGVTALPSVKDGSWKLTGEGMTLVWTLKPRAWHDGTAVTCADYVFGHTVARSDQVPVVTRDLTNRIGEVVCSKGAGGTEITVRWKERYPFANLGVTEYGAVPRHALEQRFRENPSGLKDAPHGRDPQATVGDGAYRLVEWRKGSSLTVESVANHPILGTPRIRRLTWRVMADTNALVAAMLAGGLDAISTIGISFEQAVQLEKQAQGRFRVFFEPGMIWEHIDVNLDNPLLRDVRVRRAILHAIDRGEIVRRLFEDKQPIAHTYLPPKHPGYTGAVPTYPYDPGRARELLRQAGLAPGPDGILRDRDGRRLALELSTTAGNRVREQAQQIIQQNLRAVGIEIAIRNFPVRVFFGEITNRRRFPGLAMYAWVLSPTADCDQLYTSDGIPAEGNGWAGQNYPGYMNAEMDRVCRAASQEIDEARRREWLHQSAVIFARDLPALPLYVRVSVAVAKTGLANFQPVQLGHTYETWNAHRWAWR